MKRMAIGCVVALGLVFVGVSSAQAGETSGNGKPVPGAEKASSVCAYSGRDLPDAQENQPPQFNDDFVTDGRVQSYGRYVSHGFKDAVPSPGEACRGNVEFAE
ncbi:hypothetical protein E3T26_14650 [Cryobacterium sp. TMT1-21]|uniref:Adenylate cyclase n=1 Tax=Cryobacterium shii TaxID=1259235 RepID=A0AAQ2C412_9MICO|nr:MULTISPECIES: hypothetical protein [Cryobacterium]TFC42009.1 hypothetical protein E3O49_14980 [Cryobacterium shii]TFC81940.1 hypothetical protein E3T24_14375 [Cryobacterium sp. TmT2-59]TFD09569.1 hypothetical protein E3T26_14650 [Cryobacterium sp. TMT1-21]TFD18379.1 hypothetical protein E3T32_12430 [Cryobacterium sp. TMT2-23]TFD18413.1 hypothetical protein E3T42_06015 [Cryobacterium sp. TMT4-10]